mmetsp:Transcript_133348/g.385955  ORF Transcript_133348/g.385955 Transcript_133348/m.385955 type:complete len:230 (+) Transcript_133348:600-1289(+)
MLFALRRLEKGPRHTRRRGWPHVLGSGIAQTSGCVLANGHGGAGGRALQREALLRPRKTYHAVVSEDEGGHLEEAHALHAEPVRGGVREGFSCQGPGDRPQHPRLVGRPAALLETPEHVLRAGRDEAQEQQRPSLRALRVATEEVRNDGAAAHALPQLPQQQRRTSGNRRLVDEEVRQLRGPEGVVLALEDGVQEGLRRAPSVSQQHPCPLADGWHGHGGQLNACGGVV